MDPFNSRPGGFRAKRKPHGNSTSILSAGWRGQRAPGPRMAARPSKRQRRSARIKGEQVELISSDQTSLFLSQDEGLASTFITANTVNSTCQVDFVGGETLQVVVGFLQQHHAAPFTEQAQSPPAWIEEFRHLEVGGSPLSRASPHPRSRGTAVHRLMGSRCALLLSARSSRSS